MASPASQPQGLPADLPAGQPRVIGPDVLVEPQRPARAQDPAGFGQRLGESGTVYSTRLATTVSKAASGKGGCSAVPSMTFDGHSGCLGGVVGAGASPGADLQDRPGGLFDQATAVVGAAEWVVA